MRRRIFGSVIGQPASGGGTFPPAFSAWSARIKITILASRIGSALTDFPVYVDLSTLPASFFTTVNSDGGDIRVTKADGETEVPREVVDIDDAAETGELHFLADGTLSSSTDTDFYIYYGNSGASDYVVNTTYGAEKVWESNYYYVDHGLTGFDSSGTGANGTLTGGTESTGKIGSSIVFDGVDDYLSIPAASRTSSSGHISLWQKTSEKGAVVSLGGDADSEYFQLVYVGSRTGTLTNETVLKYISTSNMQAGAGWEYTDGTAAHDGNWHHIILGNDGANDYIYFDKDQKPITTPLPQISGLWTDEVSAQNYYVASEVRNSGSNIYFHPNQVDEIRIAAFTPNADWVAAEYENQHSPGTFYSVGTPEIN